MYMIDASAMVSIIAEEDDASIFSQRIDSSRGQKTSPLAFYETVLALVRIRKIPLADAIMITGEYLKRAEIELLPVPADAHIIALGAHQRYGKGTGHRAQLNMEDCFIYALAKQHNLSLLYKGDDFAHTDLA